MISIAFGLLANMALGFNTYATHLNTKRTETSFYYIVLYLGHSGVFFQVISLLDNAPNYIAE